MKKVTSLIIGCSLALAGAAMAQAPEASPSPKGKGAKAEHHGGPAGEAHAPEGAAPGAAQHAPPPAAAHQHGAPAAPNAQGNPAHPGKAGHNQHQNKAEGGANAPQPGAAQPNAAQPAMTPATGKQHGHGQNAESTTLKTPGGKHNKNAPAATPAASAAAQSTPAPVASATPAAPSASPKAAATSSAAAEMRPSTTPAAPTTSTAASPAATAPAAASPASAVAAQGTPRPNTPAATKKPAPQQVQQIKSQHASFRAQPRPQIAPPVQFNPSYRIQNAERWSGPQYDVYRSYRPERHDQGWYHSHYQRVELIGGGYYAFNNGYWYPAWGYNPQNEYYAYDAPIYVGHRAEPPDQVIADVQAELKEMGYYTGEVDGLLGPLTRHALEQYQTDSGLQVTEVIDAPTLDSLNLAS
jgi:hypothetical protein